MQTTTDQKKIDKIRELGYKIALDDLSSDTTLLNYMEKNNLDIVKLGRELICSSGGSKDATEILEIVMRLSEVIGFDVVAEFVETKEIMGRMRAMGCDCYQGYMFSPAMPLEQYKEYIMKY